jgi:hypothetical protein
MNIEEEESTRMRVNRKDQEMMEKSETKTRLIQQKPKETKSKFKKPTMEKKKGERDSSCTRESNCNKGAMGEGTTPRLNEERRPKCREGKKRGI